jgi:hypothetical protein
VPLQKLRGDLCLFKSVVPTVRSPRLTGGEKEPIVGIRETLNKNPSITTGVTIGIIVVALVAIIWQAMGNRPDMTPPRTFYTIDDGKTWFDDEANKIPPFDAKGGQAVRCYVFRCGEKGNKFVGYLERYKPDAATKMAELMKKGSEDPMAMEQVQMTGMEIKKPGDAKWVSRNTPQAEKIMADVKCPDGTQNNLEPVSPND